MESAVEWLVANLDIDLVDSDWYIEKAKEMEKQVNAETWNNAIDAQLKDKWESFEQYYNEVFKSK